MFILLYIFLGLLFFDFLVACCIYFRKERLFDTREVPLNHLKTVKLPRHDKSRLAV
jgi:hypothetical protein